MERTKQAGKAHLSQTEAVLMPALSEARVRRDMRRRDVEDRDGTSFAIGGHVQASSRRIHRAS